MVGIKRIFKKNRKQTAESKKEKKILKRLENKQIIARWKMLRNPIIFIFAFILLFTCARIMYQVAWALFTALKDQNEFRDNVLLPPLSWPWMWEWNNFGVVLKNFRIRIVSVEHGVYYVGLLEQLYNTIIYCVTGAVTSILVPCLVAYVTATYDFKFNKFVYSLVIFAMILPIIGTGASQVVLFKAIGIYDNLYAFNLLTKCTFLSSSYLIFFATFSGISKTYREAGYIDGASDFQVMTRIMLPQASGMIFILMFLQFVAFWEDWKAPNIYLPSYPTLSLGVFQLSQSTETHLNTITIKMAGAILLALPITLLYLLNKSKIVGKISMIGGIKE